MCVCICVVVVVAAVKVVESGSGVCDDGSVMVTVCVGGGDGV